MSIIIKGENHGIAVEGTLNIEHMDFDFSTGVKSVSGVSQDTEYAEVVETDNPLDSEAAWELWRKAQRAGWVDADRKPLLSEPQMAMIGSAMRHKLGLEWQPFEDFWHIHDLANKLSKAQYTKYYTKFDKDIDEVLG